MTDLCEIEGCGAVAVASMGGVAACDRCTSHWVSVGYGAVRFGGRWHGVTGASYTEEQTITHPGLVALSPTPEEFARAAAAVRDIEDGWMSSSGLAAALARLTGKPHDDVVRAAWAAGLHLPPDLAGRIPRMGLYDDIK